MRFVIYALKDGMPESKAIQSFLEFEGQDCEIIVGGQVLNMSHGQRTVMVYCDDIQIGGFYDIVAYVENICGRRC